ALGRQRTVILDPTRPRLVRPSNLAGVHSVRYPGEGADADEGWDAVRQELAVWLQGEEFRQHTRSIVAWPNPTSQAAGLLRPRRALDAPPPTPTAASELHVTRSTHQRGIAGGFGHSLPYHRGAEAFESFAEDALALWKSAHANAPGHGLTLAACWEPESGPLP